jgi:hypothetical protein
MAFLFFNISELIFNLILTCFCHHSRMKRIVCMQCRYFGNPVWKKRGSSGAETVAWLFFPLGIPYTLWRILSKRKVCKQCGGTHIVDMDSPSGEMMMNKIMGVEGVDTSDQKVSVVQGKNLDVEFEAFLSQKKLADEKAAEDEVMPAQPVVAAEARKEDW